MPLRSRPWAALGVAGLAAFMVFLDTQVLFVAFPDIRASFATVSYATLSWTLTAYTVALAATLVPAGRLADRWGRRRMFIVGLVGFTVASALCALAPNPAALIGFRVLQAVGAAALVPSSLALVLSVFPPARVPVAVAVWGSISALAAAFGPTVGALLVQEWGWRAVFLANLPVGLVALLLAPRFLPESREAARGRFPDALGVALLAVALTFVTLGVAQSGTWHWGSGRTLGSIAGGLVMLGGFVRRTLRVPHPAVDLRLFEHATFRWGNITTAAFTVGFTAMFFASVQFLTQVWRFGIVHAGLVMMPGPVVVVVLAPRMGALAARFGQRALLVPGGLLWAASGLWLREALGTTPQWATHMLPASLLAGLAVSLVIPQLVSVSVQDLPSDERAVGSAVNQAIRQLGATFGVAITVAVLDRNAGAPALAPFQQVWLLLVACGVLTSLASLRVPTGSRDRARRVLDDVVSPVPASR